MSEETVFVLVHSPLVGPLTWLRVAAMLRSLGQVTVTPTLHDDPASSVPSWQQHADSVAQVLTPLPAARPLVLVGHSGAGRHSGAAPGRGLRLRRCRAPR